MCPCPQSMWDELGLGGPPVVVPTGRPTTREAAVAELRACSAALDEVRASLAKIEHSARAHKDVIVALAARDHGSQAFALARRVEEDSHRIEAPELGASALDVVGADCDTIATLAREVPNMVAIDCTCGR